ncbi:MGMT family protein, partial [Streptomyces sp. MT29]|nr:MGMT family protein [Streptomyces sp. MT29]
RRAAIGRNPLLVVRRCHRVIGADGALRGYAGGLERKQLLLRLEGAACVERLAKAGG